jgi:hypothetical protein
VTGLQEASGFEGLIILGVIYFVLSLVQKAGKRATQLGQQSSHQPPSPGNTAEEGHSLDTLLKEIERVKRQKQLEHPVPARRTLPVSRRPRPMAPRRAAPPHRPDVIQDERGPLGRTARTPLEGAEEVEVRTSLEDQGSLEVTDTPEISEELLRRRERVVVDLDEQAEAVSLRRQQEAAARNRSHAEADHRAFDQRVRTTEAPSAVTLRYTPQELRQAFIWREILGPPKSLED